MKRPIPTGHRWAAQLRSPRLYCGQHSDPILHDVQPDHPSNFSMEPSELDAEVRRCRDRGFMHWEIRRVFAGVNTR